VTTTFPLNKWWSGDQFIQNASHLYEIVEMLHQ